MVLLAFLIPLCLICVGVFFFKKKFRLEELAILALISIVTVVASYFIMKTSSLHDTEYNGYFITEARYYEPYSTWIDQTCSRTVTHGKTTTTEYYDCSYCKNVSDKYELIDAGNNTYSVSKETYEAYVRMWKQQPPQFLELNRDIDTNFSCGKDGDAYFVNWDKSIENSVTSTKSVSYKNILKSNKSAFNYKAISKEFAKTNKLYEYPEIDYYRQQNILGLDSTSLSVKQKQYISKHVEYLNGLIGPTRFARVYYTLFIDQPIETAFLQESYWEGGNRNEINICIGIDKSGNIKWSYPFSWTKNKRVIVDVREDMTKIKNINEINKINSSVYTALKTNYKYRDFNDFNYLSWEPSKWQIFWIYFIIAVVSTISFIIMVKNNWDN